MGKPGLRIDPLNYVSFDVRTLVLWSFTPKPDYVLFQGSYLSFQFKALFINGGLKDERFIGL
jgi:hypothetical protein